MVLDYYSRDAGDAEQAARNTGDPSGNLLCLDKKKHGYQHLYLPS